MQFVPIEIWPPNHIARDLFSHSVSASASSLDEGSKHVRAHTHTHTHTHTHIHTHIHTTHTHTHTTHTYIHTNTHTHVHTHIGLKISVTFFNFLRLYLADGTTTGLCYIHSKHSPGLVSSKFIHACYLLITVFPKHWNICKFSKRVFTTFRRVREISKSYY
jgi:hypothetical protein